MCGICGYVGLDDKELLKRMCDVQRHRGPDAEGLYQDGEVGLGNRRLSIIDLATGDQPLHNEDESVWVTFNGEIYNYVELRQQLTSKGHEFYTESDTEVLVHLYEEYGANMVNVLRGMFAFGLWDSENRLLMLARDRLGKKPLYYAKLDNRLFFASEAKGILQYEEYVPTVNLEGIDYFLSYGYIPSPLTAFQGINKLPPGSLLLYEDDEVITKSYWDLSFPTQPQRDDAQTVLAKLHEVLRDAVRLRLRSDVPLGAFLSGGIDSSTIVAIASRLAGSSLKTFSIGYDNDAYSELPFAKSVASQLGTDHYELILQPDAFKVLPTLVWHFDEPFADMSAIPTYFVSRLARSHVKVALTGDGGDEMFMGYPWMADPQRNLPTRLKIRLLSLKRKAQAAIKREPQTPPLTLGDRYVLRVSKIDESELEQIYTQRGKENRSIQHTSNYLLKQFEVVQKLAGDNLSQTDYVTIKSYLPEDILVKVDRASMAVSLEPRSPFLDHVVSEFAASIPPEMKMNHKRTKIILRQYAQSQRLIPDQILERQKQGFGIPLENWFADELKVILEKLLLGRESTIRTYIREAYIEALVKDRSNVVSAQRLFCLIMFELWNRMFIDREARSKPSLDIEQYL